MIKKKKWERKKKKEEMPKRRKNLCRLERHSQPPTSASLPYMVDPCCEDLRLPTCDGVHTRQMIDFKLRG